MARQPVTNPPNLPALGLVLVPRRRRPVRVDDQGPAPAVDDDLVVEGAEQDAVLMGIWQATADAVQGCEPLVKTAGLPAGSMPASSLAGDAFVETGRIWRVRLVPVIPGDARDLIPGVRSGLRRRPPIVRHAGLPARKPWFAAVWVVVA